VSRVNVGPSVPFAGVTHEGGHARATTDLQALRRSVLSCMLFEDEFYESGQSIADRIKTLVNTVGATDPAAVAALAVEARTQMKLRHVPLLIVREMARTPTLKPYVATTLASIIQRADELAEFVALYWKDGGNDQPLSAQVKKGLAQAFTKFTAYQFAKYNRDTPVKLRDVLFQCHAKPLDGRKGYTRAARKAERASILSPVNELRDGEVLFKQIVDDTLPTPDTWEVQLSAGGDKREVFTRLITERKLGALALLRNLRNMTEAKVNDALIREAIVTMHVERVLPFRFLAAAKYAPRFVDALDIAMVKCLRDMERLPGTTVVLVDGSASMEHKISDKSEISRLDAAAAIAIICRALSDHCRTYVFSDIMREAPAYQGIALADALKRQVPAVGTRLGTAVRQLNTEAYDRLIVITDEQSADTPPGPRGKGYVINVGSYQKGVGYGPWTHVDGWSERVIDFIREAERQ